jgi:hypothetical protein
MLDRPSSKPGPSEPDGSVEGSRVLVATLCVRLLRSTLQVTRSNMDPVRDNFCVHAPQHRTIGVTVDAHTYHGAPFARRRMGNPHAQRRHRFLPSRVELHSTRSALSACRQGDQPRDNSCLDPCHHPDRPPESTYLPTPTLAARFHKQATRACSVQASTSPTAPRARRPCHCPCRANVGLASGDVVPCARSTLPGRLVHVQAVEGRHCWRTSCRWRH